MPMPEEIVGLLRTKITFKWPDGHESVYPARYLRLRCRCAQCVEEMSGAPLLDAATVPEDAADRAVDAEDEEPDAGPDEEPASEPEP